jgi:uncharacterized protein
LAVLAWLGVDAPRMEIARVEQRGARLVAEGTQVGAVYELRYRLEPDVLALDLVGERSLVVELGDADFFDLGLSPLFNSLPVIRDGLLGADAPRDYAMRWIDVPSLEIHRSEQRYEPLGNGVVRYRDATFTADIRFDADGFVLDYPGLARRVAPPA